MTSRLRSFLPIAVMLSTLGSCDGCRDDDQNSGAAGQGGEATAAGNAQMPGGDAQSPAGGPEQAGAAGGQPVVHALLAQSHAAYTALQSYADSGVVTDSASEALWYRYKFRTRFRRPSDFYFEYGPGVSKSGEMIFQDAQRVVFWKLGADLETWREKDQAHESFPAGQLDQVAALKGGNYATRTAITLIPSFLFKAVLGGTLQQFAELTDAGTETINGHLCRKLIGVAQQYYPSGRVTGVRQVTVWVDAQTHLIRKVFEDTPKGAASGVVNTRTFIIYPQANPALDDSKFQFAVPSPQQ